MASPVQSINAQIPGNFAVRMAGSVQGFGRLYTGHGQLVGHARLARHFRAEIASHDQSLQWPVFTRTCAAGLNRAITPSIPHTRMPGAIRHSRAVKAW
jgi:hypothetical protein